MAVSATKRNMARILSILIINEEMENGTRRERKATLPYIMQRQQLGAFHALVQELAEQDPRHLHKFLRMSGETFDDLLHLVGPALCKENTNYKDSICAEERLAVTLRFLAEGGSYSAMFFLFRIPVATLAYLIPETCAVIYLALKDTYLKSVLSTAVGLDVTTVDIHDDMCHFHAHRANGRIFKESSCPNGNFHNVLGAMDGKHVKIICPRNAGSQYYNYMGFHSFVLFAVVDADYKFLYYEVGAPGRVGDSTIWNASKLKRDLEAGCLHLPPPITTPTSYQIPSLIVADSAFALSPSLMKPYAARGIDQERRLFNYRLSRARRIVENAFGILACRFGIYQSAIKLAPERGKQLVLATLALHNFLRTNKDQQYCGPAAVDHDGHNHDLIFGQWRANNYAQLFGLQPVVGGAHPQHVTGTEVRDALKHFFSRQGAVPWQYTQL